MAEKKGTGGRGGTGPIQELDLSAFAQVSEDAELSRSRTEPSIVKPLVDLARQHLGRKFEQTDVRMEADENGEPVPVTDADGNIVRDPHIYTLAEAEEFAAQLRNAGQRDKLPAKRLSLRVVAEPSLKSAKDNGIDKIRVQFYVVRRTPQTAADDS